MKRTNKQVDPAKMLKIPDLEQTKNAVLNTLDSIQSRRSYEYAMTEFISWYCSAARLALNRSVVLQYRTFLENKKLAASTINVRLAAVRRLVYEAADNGILSPDVAAGIRRVKGVRQIGHKVGNWLSAQQGQDLLGAISPKELRGKRDAAMLSLLLACGLRRSEVVGLASERIQRRGDHWAIVDFVGKAGHVRTVPVPEWVKDMIDAWTTAAGLTGGLLFRAIQPLPYWAAARLVSVYETSPGSPRNNLSYPDYRDLKNRNRVLRSLDAYQQTSFVMTTAAGAQWVRGARVSAGFFRTLGVSPVVGRDFETGEDAPSSPRVALLSYRTWQQRFGGRGDVLGQTAILDGFPYVIIGVLPREFHFAPAGRPDFWAALQAASHCDISRQCHTLYGVARLQDGISQPAAAANLNRIAADLEKEYPDSNRDRAAAVAPLVEWITGTIHPMLMVLLGGAGLLLLIAAVNVAGLVLLRSQSRRREIAVRAALGASSGRLVAQFATEGLALAACGGVLGVALAGWMIRLLQKLVPESFRLLLPFLDCLAVNSHVLLAGTVIALLAAVLLALPPCIGIRRCDVRGGLAEGSRGSAGTVWRRVGSNLVVLELAAAMVLLVGSGLLSKSLYRLMRVDLGIEPDHLLALEVVAPRITYSTDAKAEALVQRIEDEVGNLPGVKSVGATDNGVPVGSNGNTTWFHLPDRPWHGEHDDAPERDVTPSYFSTLGARLLRGRYFNASDNSWAPPVIIVNRTFVRTYYPSQDAVGKQVVEHTGAGLTLSIVGVVDDIREGPLDAAIPPIL
jgi:macrolide transport system ATP-binding/permease protein